MKFRNRLYFMLEDSSLFAYVISYRLKMAMTGLTVLGSAPQNQSSADNLSNLLVVVLDLNASWWADQLETLVPQGSSNGTHDQQLPSVSLSSAVDQILVSLNCYTLIHPNNKVVVLGSLRTKSHFLYPPEVPPSESVPNDSRPELFRLMNYTVLREIKRVLLESLEDSAEQEQESRRESIFVGALARSLCYIHRIQREAPRGQTVQARILVLETGADSSSHYMHFINSVFTAQKMNVKIDACVLGEDSILLQQAVDLTNGMYVKVEHPGGIAQVLNSIFILDASERNKLAVPEKIQVDYRAACFCHQKLIEVGWVCSVCLSVFCAFSPMCSTCQTTFKFTAGGKKRKFGEPVGEPSTGSPVASAKKIRGDAETNGKMDVFVEVPTSDTSAIKDQGDVAPTNAFWGNSSPLLFLNLKHASFLDL